MQQEALLIAVVTEPVALGLIKSPGRNGRGHRRRGRPVDRRRTCSSAARTSGCSRAARSTCARCRDGSRAKPSMPRASAASC